jgi:hypothetical protein
MNISRMIDIDDNSHSWLYPPLLKTAQVELIGGWVTRIALFHLLTIKNDPETTGKMGKWIRKPVSFSRI